jgi:hypothetical protein
MESMIKCVADYESLKHPAAVFIQSPLINRSFQ